MYSMTFERNDGKRFLFDARNDIVFDMTIGDGLDIDISTSQGFSQIGDSVEGRTISGKAIPVKGVIFKNVPDGKKRLRDMFTPHASGRLVYGEYHIDVTVKKTPYFSPTKDNGRFTMEFYAPFPFWVLTKGVSALIGGVSKQFRFPVNYSQPHRFGTTVQQRFIKAYNEGAIKVPYHLHIDCAGASTNLTFSNLETFETLKLNGKLIADDALDVYKKDNILHVELTRNGDVQDVLHWVDERSTLFNVNTGDNLFAINDDEGGAGLLGRLSFNPAVVNVYEA